MNIARLLQSFAVLSTCVLFGCLTGFLAIPIPYRPGSTVEPDFELRADNHWPWGESVAKAIAHSDQRTVIVDTEEFLAATFPSGDRTLYHPGNCQKFCRSA